MPEPTDSLQADQEIAALEAERRREERHRCNRFLMIRVLAKPSFQSYRAIINDISKRSIGLVMVRAFEPNTLLAIQLQSKHTGVSGILTAQVRRTVPLPNGNWFLGCSLSRPLTDDALLELLCDRGIG
jgi:PilZ domain